MEFHRVYEWREIILTDHHRCHREGPITTSAVCSHRLKMLGAGAPQEWREGSCLWRDSAQPSNGELDKFIKKENNTVRCWYGTWHICVGTALGPLSVFSVQTVNNYLLHRVGRPHCALLSAATCTSCNEGTVFQHPVYFIFLVWHHYNGWNYKSNIVFLLFFPSLFILFLFSEKK